MPTGYVSKGNQGLYFKAAFASSEGLSRADAVADCQADNAQLMAQDTPENVQITQELIGKQLMFSSVLILALIKMFLDDIGGSGSTEMWSGLSNPSETSCTDAGCEAFWVKEDGTG